MFLATYAEKAGSGILDTIKLSRVAGVRTPEEAYGNDRIGLQVLPS